LLSEAHRESSPGPVAMQLSARGKFGTRSNIIVCAQRGLLLRVTTFVTRGKSIFANRYKLVLTSEDEPRAKLDRERGKLAKQIDREESQSENVTVNPGAAVHKSAVLTMGLLFPDRPFVLKDSGGEMYF
jgi:hypothetical protein